MPDPERSASRVIIEIMDARRRTTRRLWSETHARRDEIVAVALALGFVLVMAVGLVVVSHAWTAASVSAAAR